jgi:thioesterase domain-containing protein
MEACPAAERRALANHVALIRNYRHRPAPVRVSLFRTRSHPMFCSFDPLYCWDHYALGGVDARPIPGTHENILKEPRVRSLALQLRAALNTA